MLDIRPLTKDLEDAARENINEDPERREKDVAYIKDWLSKQPHLRARTDDQFLITFLRGCKFSLERTKEKLDAYYTYRTAMPEFFKNRDPFLPELQDIFNKGIQLSLGTDAEGHHVWLMMMHLIDTSKHNVDDILKAVFMVFEIIFLECDHAAIFGQKVLADCHNITLAHMAMWTPTVTQKSVSVWQNGYPCRIAGIEYINTPGFFGTLINLVKTVLKEKIRKRLYVHQDVESLKERGLLMVLPEEFGGENQSVEMMRISIKKKVESYRDYFLEDEKYGVDESRRPGKLKSVEDQLGVAGSFRQLRVD
ncbi:retinol-binding protein pinta [Anabrus simplex]|uniref:retinol-binding protein pinta n=1 Tax=Anabrus simplex TaxID=316456 RepID=UPI0034DD15E6